MFRFVIFIFLLQRKHFFIIGIVLCRFSGFIQQVFCFSFFLRKFCQFFRKDRDGSPPLRNQIFFLLLFLQTTVILRISDEHLVHFYLGKTLICYRDFVINLREQFFSVLSFLQYLLQAFQLTHIFLQKIDVDFRFGQDVRINKFTDIFDIFEARAHVKDFIKLFPNWRIRIPDSKHTADSPPGICLIGRPVHPLIIQLESLSGSRSFTVSCLHEKRYILQCVTCLCDIPILIDAL